MKPELYSLALAKMEGRYAGGAMPHTVAVDWKELSKRLSAIDLDSGAISKAKEDLDKDRACTIADLELAEDQLKKLGFSAGQIV